MKSELKIWLEEYSFLKQRLKVIEKHIFLMYGVRFDATGKMIEDSNIEVKETNVDNKSVKERVFDTLMKTGSTKLEELVFMLEPGKEDDRKYKQIVSNALNTLRKEGLIQKENEIAGNRNVRWKPKEHFIKIKYTNEKKD